MATTGARNRIHVSEETANSLKSHDKDLWLLPRLEKVVAKGKGELCTFWACPTNFCRDIGDFALEEDLKMARETGDDTFVSKRKVREPSTKIQDDKIGRLVEWNCEVLSKLLKNLALSRESTSHASLKQRVVEAQELRALEKSHFDMTEALAAEITIPVSASREPFKDASTISLGKPVEEQIKEFVQELAALYHGNPFSSFEVRPSTTCRYKS